MKLFNFSELLHKYQVHLLEHEDLFLGNDDIRDLLVEPDFMRLLQHLFQYFDEVVVLRLDLLQLGLFHHLRVFLFLRCLLPPSIQTPPLLLNFFLSQLLDLKLPLNYCVLHLLNIGFFLLPFHSLLLALFILNQPLR